MSHKSINQVVLGLLSLSFFLLGASLFLGGNERAVTAVTQFFGVSQWLPISVANKLAGGAFLVTVLCFFMPKKLTALSKVAFYLPLGISAVVLLTLLDESRWIADLGGFPVIGSGQGIIKYFAIIPLVLFLFRHNAFSQSAHVWLNYIPVAMVLFWIGGMKFLELEAKGIEPLVAASPFMSWMYDYFSVLTASYIIGVYDIVFAILLGIGLWLNLPKLILVSGLACGAVFVMTQTFLFSTPGAFSAETIITGLGHFVIKDLWYIANMAIIAFYSFFNDKNNNEL